MPVRMASKSQLPSYSNAYTNGGPPSHTVSNGVIDVDDGSSMENGISGGDDASLSGAENRQRKRLHKAAPETASSASTKSNAVTRSSSLRSNASTQRIQGTKLPRDTRRVTGQLNQSPTKTRDSRGGVGGGVGVVTARLAPSSSTLTSSPKSTTDNATVESSSTTTFYAFGNEQEDEDHSSFEFTPSADFNDVHRSIVSSEPQLSEFPAPGGTKASTSKTGSLRSRQPSVSSRIALDTATPRRKISNATNTSSPRQPGYLAETEASASNASQRRLTNPISDPNKDATLASSRLRSQEGKVPLSMRNAKSKSLQPPPQTRLDHSEAPSTPEHTRSTSVANSLSSFGPPRSPNLIKSASKSNLSTPVANRRMSTYAHAHATGLGARTVSPTDARRLKRLSTMQATPPLPSADTMPSQANTPSASPHIKASTPSLADTPEPKRKSYGSTGSGSSTNNSARTSTASLQPRLSQSFSTSRLPTLKSRPSGADEEIPPVPPLPKVLSPETEFVPSVRKSSLPFLPPGTIPKSQLRQPSDESHPKVDAETRRRRGLTLGLDTKPSNSSLKKSLQPLRLPPLNLLPLSTPTVARVNAYGVTSEGEQSEDGQSRTPTKRSGHKTPSTPLTASRATFSDTKRFTTDASISNFSRSSSSSLRASSQTSSSIPITGGKSSRHTISPYISSSLPKSSIVPPSNASRSSSINEVEPKSARRPTLNLNAGNMRQPSRDDLSKYSAEPSPSKTPDTPSSGSSIRRKLSLSWKRSSSKASHAKEEREAEYPPKYESMPPPPRLPASTTWSGPTASSPSGSKITPTPPAPDRRKTIAANGHDRTKSESWSIKNNASGQQDSNNSVDQANNSLPRASSSILAPMQRMLTNKTSTSSIRSIRQDSQFDQDDMAAEDEMKKLASKRKGLEAAAIEVDALQARANPKDRQTPQYALRQLGLNLYERGEVVDYREVYFSGNSDAKKIIGDLATASTLNFGYDDERGDYFIVAGDHLAYRYEVVDLLGKGSFGQVVRCIDHKTGGLVAIKIIRNKKRFHQQALVEVNILQKLKEWDPNQKHSLVSFTQSFYFRGHLCISTELLGMNLYEFIKSNDFRGFSLRLIRRFTKQLLSSLLLLKSKKVIHCDLKPENVLLAHPAHSEIKVIDFGSSCFETEKVYTYIQSRFYRSPEVILGMTYGLPIDMWSLGCILAELFTGYPIFPGENEQEQLACIMEVFGPPEKHLIEKSTRKKLFFDSFGKPRMIVSSKGRRRRPSSKTLSQAIKCDDEPFLDFLTRCLRWDPEKRLKPEEAVQHDFITGHRPTKNKFAYATESPIKRSTSSYLSGSRPLPEPPGQVLKAPAGVIKSLGLGYGQLQGNSSQSSTSPSKGTISTASRKSTVTASTSTSAGVKRTSNGTNVTGASSSSLPRVAARTASISGGQSFAGYTLNSK